MLFVEVRARCEVKILAEDQVQGFVRKRVSDTDRSKEMRIELSANPVPHSCDSHFAG